MTLTDFLLARIAEDEVMARECHDGNGWAPGTAGLFWYAEPGGPMQIEPARVLAECEAKRRIVALCGMAGYDPAQNELTLRYLALPYADHPDYDESWRP